MTDDTIAEREALREARNLAYGLLWNCSVDTQTVTGRCTCEARKALLETMTKTDQAAGIEAARQVLGRTA